MTMAAMTPTRFCIQCAAPLVLGSAPGDNQPRLRCPACGYVHYENPKILVSCLASWQDKVLWMRRANQPYRGLWSVPCGFMEMGETLAEAAARELFEETGVRLPATSLSLYVLGSLTWMNQVYVVFRAEMPSPDYGLGEEALEVGLFSEEEAPWDAFAFPQSEGPTRQFYRELKAGRFGVYMGEYTPDNQRTWPLPV
jgi:ADP-ribose pyrophosphatase YjhB (NUDIX family)